MFCRGAVPDAESQRRRFTEWSRREASDIDGQLIRARERARTSQTPYNLIGTCRSHRLENLREQVAGQRPRIALTRSSRSTDGADGKPHMPHLAYRHTLAE